MESNLYPRIAAKARLEKDPVTGGKTLLYPEGVLTLNASAEEILECCDGQTTLRQIAELLSQRHRVGLETIQKDITQYLSQLQSKGLVEIHSKVSPKVQISKAATTSGRPATLLYRPYGLLAELTYDCPLHCPYCSNPTQNPGGKDTLTTSEWSRVFREARGLGVLHVFLSGGEPLLRKDLEELTAAAHEAGLYTNLITSALGFSRERAQALKTAGLDSVQISFQASEAPLADEIAGTKSHERKLEAARITRELGLPLTVNTVLHRDNIDQLEELVTLAERLDAHRLELANTQYYGWAFKNKERLLPTREQIEKAAEKGAKARERLKGKMEILYVIPDYFADRPKPCMNGWGQRYITVNPKGQVLPCPTAYSIPSLKLENVREKSLDWIWLESDSFNRFRGTEWLPEPCSSCEFKEVDFGGCRCQAALLAGDPTVTDPVCNRSPERPRIEKALLASTTASQTWSYRQNP